MSAASSSPRRPTRRGSGPVAVRERRPFPLVPRRRLTGLPFGELPGRTFSRGFVRNYARLLHLDAQDLLARHQLRSIGGFETHVECFTPTAARDANRSIHLMNAELMAAYQAKGWTLYGDFGRQPLSSGTRVFSWEHWVAHQSGNGLGIRAGRFLPAYGIRFADHTAFNRRPLGLDTFDQIYGVELSHTTDRHLLFDVVATRREQLEDGLGDSDDLGATVTHRRPLHPEPTGELGP